MVQLIEGVHYREVKDVPQYKYALLTGLMFNGAVYGSLGSLFVNHEYYAIEHGLVIAKKGYRWDGPSGPTLDDETNMRASLFHDIGYQAMTENVEIYNLPYLQKFSIRRAWDKLFRSILKEDGMPFFRRQYYFLAVRGFGGFFANF